MAGVPVLRQPRLRSDRPQKVHQVPKGVLLLPGVPARSLAGAQDGVPGGAQAPEALTLGGGDSNKRGAPNALPNNQKKQNKTNNKTIIQNKSKSRYMYAPLDSPPARCVAGNHEQSACILDMRVFVFGAEELINLFLYLCVCVCVCVVREKNTESNFVLGSLDWPPEHMMVHYRRGMRCPCRKQCCSCGLIDER